MRAIVVCVAGMTCLAACGPAPEPVSPEPIASAGSEQTAEIIVPAVETPPLPPCAAAPPSRESLAGTSRGGIVRIDADAPGHTGECISPALVLGADEVLACDADGLRCRIGARRVLLAREIEGACVPFALIESEGDLPDEESEPVAASLAQHREACALHDLVARGDPSFYEVDRVRQIAPGRRGALISECITDVDATASAAAARAHWSSVPLACHGLRCRDASPEVDAEQPLWLFAHRIAGPLRLDAIASGALPAVMVQLRERCR